jgi:coproporphyrinogen III oxidase-like Fe-S oxidoreductase
MWLENQFKYLLRSKLTKTGAIRLVNKYPHHYNRFQDLEELGLYLHIPFCRQICPYCPYNKELFTNSLAERYADAVIKEIDLYSRWVGDRRITSFYIGGGTPTTMLYGGLERILAHLYNTFNMQSDIHLESHPNDLSPQNLAHIISLGVKHLSIGVEALQDHHLETLHRPYTVSMVKSAVQRAVQTGFTCVNTDFIFALPGHTYQEVEQAAHMLVELGIHQVAAYPLFTFPYTKWSQISRQAQYHHFNAFTKRKMLLILEQIFHAADFERTSVWAFTKKSVPKYCSVTVPLYLGLGASGASYFKDVFYLNTFNVGEYIHTLEDGRLPIALSLELTESMQMAGWLYWRVYETRFNKSEFMLRFERQIDEVYGRYLRLLSRIGFLSDNGEEVVLTSAGAYWLHYIQDMFSIDYISKLWGTSKHDPWPDAVLL